VEYDFFKEFGKDYNWLVEQPENKIYQYVREKQLREIREEMERILRTPGAGEKAIESLPREHPVRKEYVRIKGIARVKELKEHKRVLEQIKKMKGG
jgi:hypothetical protein